MNTVFESGCRINYEDVIGVSHEISKNPDADFSNILVYHYPIIKGKRVKQTIIIKINNSTESDKR